MPISLFVTCLADTLFPDAGKATVTLLERLGRQVDFPQGQGCCGQMHVNTGYQRAALLLVRRYAEASTASVTGLIGLPDRASYCASKGAVIALTKQIAVRWAGAGIRGNCICPGTVDFPRVGRLAAQAEDPAARRAELIARQPMGRLGQPARSLARPWLRLATMPHSRPGTALVIAGGILAG